jgi:hypothetical protein
MAEELKEVLILDNSEVKDDNKELCYSCLGYLGIAAICIMIVLIAYYFWK